MAAETNCCKHNRDLSFHSSGGQKSRYFQSHTTSKGSRENVSLPLPALSGSLACGSIPLISASVFKWPSPSCLFMSFSMDLGPILNQHEFTLHGCVLSGFCRVQLFVALWIVFQEATQSMGFSGQEYWSGFLCPPPGDLLNPAFKPPSLISPTLAGRFYTTSATWEAHEFMGLILK